MNRDKVFSSHINQQDGRVLTAAEHNTDFKPAGTKHQTKPHTHGNTGHKNEKTPQNNTKKQKRPQANKNSD